MLTLPKLGSGRDSALIGAVRRRAVHAGPLLTCMAAVLLSACGAPPRHGPPPSEGKPGVGYIVLAAEKVALTTELPGRIAPVMVADVRPQVTGLIQRRAFTEGADVRAGALLYQIDPAPYRATLDSAQAALAKAQSTLRLAQLKDARYKELVAIRAVSQQDFDDADAATQQAAADVASAKASRETAEINLGYTRITAPVSGRIGRSSVTPGALVTANQTTALATVQQLDPVYVDLTQSSSAILRLRRAIAAGGLSAVSRSVKAQLLLEDGTPYPLEGTLQFSDVTVDQSTGVVTVRAVFPNPNAELLPGMYVRARITEAVREAAILAPQQAVTRDASGQAVAYVVGKDDRLEARPLQLGRAIGDRWLVDAGLVAGDRLVVDGAQKASAGAQVVAVPYGGATPAGSPAKLARAAVPAPVRQPSGAPAAGIDFMADASAVDIASPVAAKPLAMRLGH